MVPCHSLRQELERHKAMKFGVLGLKDHTHPAATELLNDSVMRDGLADHRLAMLGVLLGEVNGQRPGC